VHHFNMLAIAYWPARFAGVKRIVVTEHSNYLMRTQSSARRIARRYGSRVDLITVVHQGLADYLVDEIGVDAARVRVIPNGVDTLVFRPGGATPLRQQLGIPPDACVVGYVGRLHPDKDPINLIRAITCLNAEQREGLQVVFIGDGACMDEMRRLIDEHALDSTVRLLGERHDVPALLKAMDVFVLPSRTEGLPVALLEAMSTGLPIVATDVGGVPGAAGDGGLIVPPENPEALAGALARLLDDQSERTRLGEQARRRAVDCFDRSLMFEAYMAALLPPEVAA
jgi:glycosyltransferase involved in cell wall biosynthesis